MQVVRRLLGVGLFVAVLVVGWRFAAENSARVTIDMLVSEIDGVSLWAALLVSFASGAAAAGAIGLYRVARLGLVARRYRKAVRGLEAEVHQLRNLPLSTDAPAPGGSIAGAAAGPSPGGALERGT